MSDRAPDSPPTNPKQSGFHFSRSWKVGFGVAIVMVVLALLGVGLTTTSRANAPTYWMALVPVYGLLCIGVAWYRSRLGEGGPRLVFRQVIHWLGVAGAIAIDFFIRRSGEETGVSAGFTALLILALGCFLAGVHLDWLFSLVGILLTATLIVAVRADQYLWLVVLGGAVIIVVMIVLMRYLAKSTKSAAATVSK